MEVKQS